ncbi:MAG: flavin reductase family protein [Bacteroidota bacterium]
MLAIDPKKTPQKDLHQYLLGCVAPRPIAFASTVDENGNHNIAPYSFFNCFSSAPPIVIFSSNRRGTDNTTKDTLHNIQTTGEVVINMVSHSIVHQMAVASISFPPEVDEFKKSGLTPIPSDLVKPYRVAESPAQLECKVQQIISLGDQGGAGNLIICEVVRIHIDENVLNDNKRIDPHKIDLMGRMGRAFYVRASGENIYSIYQRVTEIAIGYDQLPESIRNSEILTGNNLGQLAGLTALPTESDVQQLKNDEEMQRILNSENAKETLHTFAKTILDETDNRKFAAEVLMLADMI